MGQDLTKLLGQFKHREVRDLAWVIASPPLVSSNILTNNLDETHWWSNEDCLSEFKDCLLELKKLDLNPEALVKHLLKLKNRRLGSIFEGLVSFWLSISPNYRELAQNIQVIADNHTYGEVDFIIEDLATGEVIHLEVAVKFYLGCEPYEDPYRWFGTNTKDQLGKKIDHLKLHQTQLSKKHPEKLKEYFDRTIDRTHCIIKGRLFYPESSDISPQISSQDSSQNLILADNHLRGRWCYTNDRDLTNTVIKINKSHWLAELNSEDIEDTEELKFATTESIATIDRAECYVETETNDRNTFEKQRVFYLPKAFSFPELK